MIGSAGKPGRHIFGGGLVKQDARPENEFENENFTVFEGEPATRPDPL
jgi:hypothetical protein